MNIVSKQGYRVKPSLGLKMPTFTLSRQMQYIFNPSTLTGTGPNPGNWLLCASGTPSSPGLGAVLTDLTVLSDFTGAADITRLFRQYKIVGCKYEFIPSTTNVVTKNVDTADGILLRATPNSSGIRLNNTDNVDLWLQKSAVRKYILPNSKKATIYCACTQPDIMTLATGPTTANQFRMEKSKWLPTDYYDVPHFSLDLRMDSLDASNLGDPNIARPIFTVNKTVYFQTRGLI